VRVRVGGRQPFAVRPTVVSTDGPGDPSRGTDQVGDQDVVDQSTGSVAARYGLTRQQLRPRVLAAGNGSDGERIVLFGATFPSGATGAWLLTYQLRADGWDSSLGRLPHAPAGTPLEDRLIAVPVDGFRLALAAPEGAVRAEVLTTRGEVIGGVDLDGGSYVGEVPGGSFAPGTGGAAKVRALDAAGRTLAEVPIDRVVAE
jgi:hypothetical protein